MGLLGIFALHGLTEPAQLLLQLIGARLLAGKVMDLDLELRVFLAAMRPCGQGMEDRIG